MRQTTGLLLGYLLVSTGPPAYQGRYYHADCRGPHGWEQVVELRSHQFTSTEWRTGFFDRNTQTLTGVVRQQGDTLRLVPQAIEYYAQGNYVKGKGWRYHKRHCTCQALLTDTTHPLNERLAMQRRDNQRLCRSGYVLLLTADSLTELRPEKNGFRLARGFRKVTAAAK